jgi:hypothetical protein
MKEEAGGFGGREYGFKGKKLTSRLSEEIQ